MCRRTNRYLYTRRIEVRVAFRTVLAAVEQILKLRRSQLHFPEHRKRT